MIASHPSTDDIDGILLLGFGGPAPGCCGRRSICLHDTGHEARCFVSGVLGDDGARLHAIDSVVDHYRQIGGFSPYNRLTQRQADALQDELVRRGRQVTIACGFRHWTPRVSDAIALLTQSGCRQVATVIMAPYQSSVSWDAYLSLLSQAIQSRAVTRPNFMGVVRPWWSERGHIDALVDEIRSATSGWSNERLSSAALIFTAHAIPHSAEATAPYRQQCMDTASLVSQAMGHPDHDIAFQSHPAGSHLTWSSPTIEDALRRAHARGHRDVIIQAAGFLVDHAEVLYDLDVEAQAIATQLTMRYTRARCVHDHPAFIAMLADRVLDPGCLVPLMA